MKKITITILLLLSVKANATILNYQVDKIEVSPDAYSNFGDQYSLTISGPITSTVTISLSSNSGCNLCNAIVQWGTAINNDPIMSSFLMATYDLWDGVSVVPFGGGTDRADYDPVIYLIAKTVGVEFFSEVSFMSLTTIPKTNPSFTDLTVSVSTIVPAKVAVPEPGTFALLVIGLFATGFVRRW